MGNIINTKLNFKNAGPYNYYHESYQDKFSNLWAIRLIGKQEDSDTLAKHPGISLEAEPISQQEADKYQEQIKQAAGKHHPRPDNIQLKPEPSLEVHIKLVKVAQPGPHLFKIVVDPTIRVSGTGDTVHNYSIYINSSTDTLNVDYLANNGTIILLFDSPDQKYDTYADGASGTLHGVATYKANYWDLQVQRETKIPDYTLTFRGVTSVTEEN